MDEEFEDEFSDNEEYEEENDYSISPNEIDNTFPLKDTL